MAEIVERLRAIAEAERKQWNTARGRVIKDAADEIERLRATLDQIRVNCIDNEGPAVRHDLALKFVRSVAEHSLNIHQHREEQ